MSVHIECVCKPNCLRTPHWSHHNRHVNFLHYMTYGVNSKKWRITNWQDNQHKIIISHQASRTFSSVVSDVSKEQLPQLHVPLHLNPPQHHWGNLKSDILYTAKFQILTVALPRIQSSWDVMLCCWVCRTQNAEGSHGRHLSDPCWNIWPYTTRHYHLAIWGQVHAHQRCLMSKDVTLQPSLEPVFFFPHPPSLKVANQSSYLFLFQLLLSSFYVWVKQIILAWCFFWRLWTAVRLVPRSADDACVSFSATHWSSSSTSCRNWCSRSASSRLSLRICIGCCKEWYLSDRTQWKHG